MSRSLALTIHVILHMFLRLMLRLARSIVVSAANSVYAYGSANVCPCHALWMCVRVSSEPAGVCVRAPRSLSMSPRSFPYFDRASRRVLAMRRRQALPLRVFAGAMPTLRTRARVWLRVCMCCARRRRRRLRHASNIVIFKVQHNSPCCTKTCA